IYTTTIKKRNKIIRGSYILINIIFLFIIAATIIAMSQGKNFLAPDRHMVYFIYYYILFYIPQFIYMLFSLLSRLIKDSSGIIQGLGRIIGIAAFITLFWGKFHTAMTPKVLTYNIQSPQIPESFNDYKIIQFSDLHTGNFNNDTVFIKNLVDSINNFRPDLILFTGDIVSYHSKELDPYLHILKQLKAQDGVYAVMGNHDYSDYYKWNSDKDRENDLLNLKSYFKQMNWILLDNESVRIRRGNDSIILAGMENWGEPPFHAFGDIEKTFEKIYPQTEDFVILMSHNPEFWRQHVMNKRSDIDLTLSGHTHAMQCVVKFNNKTYSPASIRYPLWGGLYEDASNSKLLVNVGIGNVFYPMRIGTKPEISYILLNR
ncbi:MAG: metallophosphoesterase, partial [Bacteroidales bacterium]